MPEQTPSATRQAPPAGGFGPAPARVLEAVLPPLSALPLLGRDADLDRVRALLADPATRLLTLIGPGGVGKTRLAVEIVRAAPARFEGRVCWLPLDGLGDPDVLGAAAAAALAAEAPVAAGLARDLPALLVLDNLEHLVAGAGALAPLLRRSPALAVLATSRAPLRLTDERLLRLAPLDYPDTASAASAAANVGAAADAGDAALLAFPAVALFVRRAAAVCPDLSFDPATVEGRAAIREAADLATLLDGLPLALELAAGQISALPLSLLATLPRDRRWSLLAEGERDRPVRHRSLRDAIDGSYRLLPPEQQRVFRRLTVLRGGITPELATTVVAAGNGRTDAAGIVAHLAALAAASLLTPPAPNGPAPRFRMLPTIRDDALERLRADPAEAFAVQQTHALAMLDLAERWRPGLTPADLNAWLDELERNLDNLRAVLEWALAAQQLPIALRFGAALGRLWDLRDHLTEGMAWLRRVVAAAEAAARSRSRRWSGTGSGRWRCRSARASRPTRWGADCGISPKRPATRRSAPAAGR